MRGVDRLQSYLLVVLNVIGEELKGIPTGVEKKTERENDDAGAT